MTRSTNSRIRRRSRDPSARQRDWHQLPQNPADHRRTARHPLPPAALIGSNTAAPRRGDDIAKKLASGTAPRFTANWLSPMVRDPILGAPHARRPVSPPCPVPGPTSWNTGAPGQPPAPAHDSPSGPPYRDWRSGRKPLTRICSSKISNNNLNAVATPHRASQAQPKQQAAEKAWLRGEQSRLETCLVEHEKAQPCKLESSITHWSGLSF